MNCIFSLVLVLNINCNVHCYSSESYDSGYSSEYDTEYTTDYSTEYESKEYRASKGKYDAASSYEYYSSSGSYEHENLKLKDDGDGIIDHEIINRFISEMKAGNPAQLFGSNPHYSQPDAYKDLSRRFIPKYPYTEVKHIKKIEDSRLTPKLASPELVLRVAKKSAILQASKPLKSMDKKAQKDILRTGEYWNDVWREDVKPERLLRTNEKKKKILEAVKVKIMPGSSLYDVVSKLKERSPRLLYIINNKQKEM